MSETIPGTMAASAHPPQVMLTPWPAASSWASGLPAMAVRNMAEVMQLTMNAVWVR